MQYPLLLLCWFSAQKVLVDDAIIGVTVTLPGPLHVSKVGQSKKKGKDHASDTYKWLLKALFGRFVWRADGTNNCLIYHHRGFCVQAHTKGVQTQPSRTLFIGYFKNSRKW